MERMGVLCQSIVLAGGVSTAIFLHIFAATSTGSGFSWWPLLPPLLAYGLVPIPVFLFAVARNADENVFDDNSGASTARHWGCFTAAALATIVLGLPGVLSHAGVLDSSAAGLTIGGLMLSVLTVLAYVGFARCNADSENSWGGSVSLLGR